MMKQSYEIDKNLKKIELSLSTTQNAFSLSPQYCCNQFHCPPLLRFPYTRGDMLLSLRHSLVRTYEPQRSSNKITLFLWLFSEEGQ